MRSFTPKRMQTFTSSTNPKIKLIRALRQRKQRDATGLFVVEGIRHVGEAAEASRAAEASGAPKPVGWNTCVIAPIC